MEVAHVFFIAAERSEKTDQVMDLVARYQTENSPLTVITKPHTGQYDRGHGQITVAHDVCVPVEIYDKFIAEAKSEDLAPQLIH